MTLVQAQQRYIDRVTACHSGHIKRVRRSARSELYAWAEARGFDARVVCRDAADMAQLTIMSED